ncbi:uncharacterized protein Z520_08530 [Fonsecaea multimorphosa CBS 102226]|uniref:Uncharacterized protein n=1 Tax=Fonsecaea multimorphosa CBS 102226 TaxID=1442371 RepID=A0A0D2JR29_9EURO|nr:uncharacterized protein Z520_08530 [Fonsecaea multimorphosa CBS 102226]KIX95822.1 hypothetical protein Z520_08530 [Fonsecaea multimorphosa CBS 102226]
MPDECRDKLVGMGINVIRRGSKTPGQEAATKICEQLFKAYAQCQQEKRNQREREDEEENMRIRNNEAKRLERRSREDRSRAKARENEDLASRLEREQEDQLRRQTREREDQARRCKREREDRVILQQREEEDLKNLETTLNLGREKDLKRRRQDREEYERLIVNKRLRLEELSGRMEGAANNAFRGVLPKARIPKQPPDGNPANRPKHLHKEQARNADAGSSMKRG